MQKWINGLTVVLALACAAPVMAQTTIGTGAAAANSSRSFDFMSAAGQSFLAPVSGSLTSFSFNISINNTFNQALGNYVFQISTITGNIIGPSLYATEFAPTTGTMTFSGLNVGVIQGTSYAAIITPFGGSATNNVAGKTIATSSANPYGSGNGFYISNGQQPDGQTVTNTPGTDALFSATFTAGAPEPATWGLMILGFGAVGGTLRRRRSPTARGSARMVRSG